MFPNGHTGYKRKAVVFLARLLIIFPATFDPEKHQSLRSINRPKFTLEQRDEYLVLTQAGKRRWYFEPSFTDGRLRLGKIEQVTHPQRFTQIGYDNDLITTVTYPNGKQAHIKNKNGLPVAIRTPMKRLIAIDRNQLGHIKQVSIYRLGIGDKQTLEKTYRYKLNGIGQILDYIDPWDRHIHIDYDVQNHKPISVLEKQYIVYTAVLRNMADGSFFYRRHYDYNGKTWDIEEGFGDSRQSPGQATIHRKRSLTKVAHRYATVSRSAGNDKNQSSYELSPMGHATTRVDPLGRVTLYQHNKLGHQTRVIKSQELKELTQFNDNGKPIRRISERGHEYLYTYDEHSRLLTSIAPSGRTTTHTYDDDGYTIERAIDDRVDQYQYDRWGRMTMHATPSGKTTHWTYDQYGQLKTQTIQNPRNSSFTEQITTYTYMPDGRLISITHPDDRLERFLYDKNGRLGIRIHKDNTRSTYGYDKSGRLKQRSDPIGLLESFEYNPLGKITRHTKVLDQNRTDLWYDNTGRLIASADRNQGRTLYEYDAVGRVTRIVHPNKTDTIYTYDTQDRITQVRGSHPTPMDYIYDKNGKRYAKPPSHNADYNAPESTSTKRNPISSSASNFSGD